MAEKKFFELKERLDLLEIDLNGLQHHILEALKEIDPQAVSKDKRINSSDDFEWSRTNIKDRIAKITNQKENHITEAKHKRYKGLYLWVEKKTNNPVYVGISQHLDKRISDHATASGKSRATWAYMMAKDKHRDQFKELQSAFQSTPGVRKYDFVDRESFQSYIRKECYCLVLLESNDYLLYLMEVYAAIKYKTYWNLFHTH